MVTPRLYDHLLQEHFAGNRQMAFVSGPRQVGKTTTCRRLASAYVNRSGICATGQPCAKWASAPKRSSLATS